MPKVTKYTFCHLQLSSWSIWKHTFYWTAFLSQILVTGVYFRSVGIFPYARNKQIFAFCWGLGEKGTCNLVIGLFLNIQL